jgi:hypothetical protein
MSMLGEAIAGAAIGGGLSKYRADGEMMKSVALGAATPVAVSYLSPGSRPAMRVIMSAGIYATAKHCLSEYEQQWSADLIDGLAVAVGSNVLGGVVGRTLGGSPMGSSIRDYTGGQAP